MTAPSIPTHGRLAGIDFGTVRIGIAITDPDRVLASPYENYNVRSPPRDAEYFRRLATEERVVGFVVGLPVHAHGGESRLSSAARKFGDWLHETTRLPVTFFDERFTSVEAEQLMAGASLTKKRRKERLDMLAAQVMLASYLDATRGRTADQSLEPLE